MKHITDVKPITARQCIKLLRSINGHQSEIQRQNGKNPLFDAALLSRQGFYQYLANKDRLVV